MTNDERDEHDQGDQNDSREVLAQHDDPQQHSPFEQIRHTDDQGEYWSARELMPLLEYNKWQDFDATIQRAIEDCVKAGRSVAEHFQNFTAARKVSTSRGPRQTDYRLTRYACRLVVMASRTTGDVAAQARTYFSDKVDEAETLLSPESAYVTWRERAIRAFIGEGYSAEWAERRVDDLVARNALTHEWSVRGIKGREFAILTDRLHMGAFGLSIEEHKGIKHFPITYKGKKLVHQGELPPAMTMTELALNALAGTVARQLHVQNDSQGFPALATDVDVAGRIAGDTRRQIEAALGQPVVSPRNMVQEPDGGLWGHLPAPALGDDR